MQLPLCFLSRLQDTHTSSPMHGQDRLILVEVQHIVRDDQDATRGELMRDAHVGDAGEGVIRSAKKHHRRQAGGGCLL